MINCWLFSSRITPYRTSLVFVDGILNAVRYIRHNISHRSNLSISCIRIYLALCFSKTIKQDHTWLVYLWLLFRSRTLMSCLGNKIHQTHQVHPEPVGINVFNADHKNNNRSDRSQESFTGDVEQHSTGRNSMHHYWHYSLRRHL